MNLKTIKILLIEDNPGDARLIHEFLKESVTVLFQIVHVDSIANAKKHLSITHFDAVLLDLGLPDSQGLDSFITIHKFSPDLPIVILSGANDLDLSLLAIKKGAQDYLVKGTVNIEILERALNYAIERKATDAEINNLVLQWQSTFDAMSDSISIIGLDRHIKYCNSATYTMLGFDASDLACKKCHELVHHTNVPICNCPFDRMKASKKLETMIFEQNNRWLEVKVDPIFDKNNQLNSAVHIVTDITDRILAEQKMKLKNDELSTLNATKDKFFSIIAHDLRSPLTSFLGISQLLAEDITSFSIPEAQKMASNLSNTAMNLHRLIENLLQWSQIQKDTILFKTESVYLKNLINESIEPIKLAAQTKNINIEIDLTTDIQVEADNQSLQTIIRNLVSNSIKFTNSGGKIKITTKPSDNSMICVLVQDTGIGMSSEMVENLFRIEFKSGRNGTQGESSTGLGLILCKEFIEKNGGEIHVESEVGIGSTFSITIPQKKQVLN